MKMKRHKIKPIAAILATAFSAQAHAVGVGTDVQLAPVVVTGTSSRAPLAADIPSSTESKTAEELREQNLFNPEDALRYVSNTTIRKRYIGDRKRRMIVGGGLAGAGLIVQTRQPLCCEAVAPKAYRKPRPKLELALGVDNVTDQHAWQFHPYPGRTMFVELRSSL